MITLFGPTGADVSIAEVTFACPAGHPVPRDVPRDDALAAWSSYRTQRRQAS